MSVEFKGNVVMVTISGGSHGRMTSLATGKTSGQPSVRFASDVSPTDAVSLSGKTSPSPIEVVNILMAAHSGNIAAIKGFIQRNLDLDGVPDGKGPLTLQILNNATSWHAPKLLDYLQAFQQAGLNFTSASHCLSAALVVVDKPNANSVAQLNFLNEQGADFTTPDAGGNTPFHKALYLTQFPTVHKRALTRGVVNWFFQNKLVTETLNKRGESPAFIAATSDPVVLRQFFPKLTSYQARAIVSVLGDYNVQHDLARSTCDKTVLLHGMVEEAQNSPANTWKVRGRDCLQDLKTRFNQSTFMENFFDRTVDSYFPQLIQELFSYVQAYTGLDLGKLRGDGLDK